MTRKKKLGNFEILVDNILDSLDELVPKGMNTIEVMGALEAAKLTVAHRLSKATLFEEMLNDEG